MTMPHPETKTIGSTPAAANPDQRRPSSLWGYWLTLGLVLLLDIVSKWIVTHTMYLYQSISLVGSYVRLTYLRNAGAAFSLLAGFNTPWRRVMFIALAGVAVISVTWIAVREKRQGLRLLLPLGLVASGALGNLLDRIQVGTVVDFIELSYRNYSWPVFNVADSAMFIGVFWLIYLSFRAQPK